MKNLDHYKKCEKIKDGTDRANGQHELANKVYVPLPGTNKVFFVDIVHGDRDFGHIVKHVVKQYLCRKHWEKRKEQGTSRHAEHVAKIGTGPHHDVLHNVAERATSLNDALLEHAQVTFQKYHFCRGLSDINGAIHGNADISRMERWSIVNPVAKVSNSVPSLL